MVQSSDDYYELPENIRNLAKESNVFYSESYYQRCKEKKLKLIYFYDNSQILVIKIIKKFIFRYAELPTELISHENAENQTCFLNKVCDSCRKKYKLDWIGPTSTAALFLVYPDNSFHIPFGSHVIDLSLSSEELWAKLHTKHRNVIRKAQRSDVKVISGGKELLYEYLGIDKITWARSNRVGIHSKVFYELFDLFGDNVHIYLAYYHGMLQGGAIFLRNKAMSYYLYGASIDSPFTGAMNYLHWIAINDCKQENIKKYSFVGCRINEDKDSKQHGIQRFKERFGGELVLGYMFKVINKPLKYKLFKCLYKLRHKRRECRDVIDQEIGKWEDKK